MYQQPYGWWGGHGWGGQQHSLSIVALMEAGTVDARLAAMLWMLMERRASVIVGHSQPLSGKTAVLTALAYFLPQDTQAYYTRGWGETFDFLQGADPQHSYILANEISPDLWVYLWGPAAVRLFACLEQGFAFGSTVHADSVAEVVALLEGPPLSIPRRQIAKVDLVVTLGNLGGGWQRERWVNSVSLLGGDGASGLKTTTLVTGEKAGAFRHHLSEPVIAALARRCGLDPQGFRQELARREEFLQGLQRQGVREISAVRQALLEFAGDSPDQPGPVLPL